jgi:hypothetical protein
MPRERLFDLIVPGNGLLLAGSGVEVDIVAGAVAVENASSLLQFSDELPTPHRAISFIS